MLKSWLIVMVAVMVGFAGSAVAAPLVSNVSGNADAFGRLTITGSGFDSNDLEYGWNGENIENGTVGDPFSASGWGAAGDSTAMQAPRYTSQRSHSGSKSILSSYTPTAYGSGYWYDFGKEADKLYATYWTYSDLASMKGQNKLWRIMGIPAHFSDGNTVIMSSQWNNNSSYVGLMSKGDSQSYWYSTDEDKNGFIYLDGSERPGFKTWARVEIYFEGGTPYEKDGTFIYKLHKNGTITQTSMNYDKNLMIYNGTTMRAKAFTIQNYVGNAADGYPRTGDEQIFTDDVFVQLGTRARVEIGDKSTWNDCTYREVQVPTSWADSQIMVTVNAGTFSSGQTAYVYVVDGDGNVNAQGYPITIGENISGGTDQTPEEEDDPEDEDSSEEDSSEDTSESMSPAWNAAQQAGYTGNWMNSTWSVCLRMLVEGSSITSSGNRFKLGFQGRSSGDYQIRKVSLAERDTDGAEGDVVDGEWIRVTFDGNDESTWQSDVTTVAANSGKLSNPIPYSIEAGKDYYVTLMIDTPGVYIIAPSDYIELYFEDSDHTEELDWGGNGHSSYSARIHVLSAIYVDNEGLPEPTGLTIRDFDD